MILVRCVNVVRQFDSDDFTSSTLEGEITLKLYNGKKDVIDNCLWQKVEECRKEM